MTFEQSLALLAAAVLLVLYATAGAIDRYFERRASRADEHAKRLRQRYARRLWED